MAAQGSQGAPDSSPNPVVEPVLADIYESALHPEHWTSSLDRLVDLFAGNGAILRTFEATPESGGLWLHTRIPQWALDEYANHYRLKDLWEIRAREGGLFRPGAAFTSDMLLPREEFLASEWYRGFLARLDIRDLLAGVVHDGARAPLKDILVGDAPGTLGDYLDFSYDGANTTIDVISTGTGLADQQIVLTGVNLTSIGEESTIISDLLANGKLITD